jgi:ribosomal protein S18 acetylase RimI-like enzyme
LREIVAVRDTPAGRIDIRPLEGDDEARACAEMMSSSEPWLTLGRTYEQCVKILTSPKREVYVGLIDGRLAGFAVLIMRGAFVGFIQSLAVAPDLRGRGIGEALMRFVEDRILRDTPNVFLCVSSFNVGAQRFYRRLGYEVVGELGNMLIRGHAEILMRKSTGPISEFRRAT